MLSGLSHSLKILSHHGIKLIGNQLRETTISWVLLSVQEPFWNVIVEWSRDDIIDNLNLIIIDFTGSFVDIDLSDLKSEESKSSTDTSNLSETEWSFLFTSQVGILNTKNVSEVVWI